LVLLHKQIASPSLGPTLLLAVAMACFFSYRRSWNERTRELAIAIAASRSGKPSYDEEALAVVRGPARHGVFTRSGEDAQ